MTDSMKYAPEVSTVPPPVLLKTAKAAPMAVPGPISVLTAPEEQHMLLLFVPIKKGLLEAAEANKLAMGLINAVSPADSRTATGVHFAMFHLVKDGAPSSIPVPTFQAPAGKDMLVALSIYDPPFDPYISAFTTDPTIAKGLDGLLYLADETGIDIPNPATSAAAILANGGVFQNSEAFIAFLMRYNFGDPTIPAATSGANIANPAPTPNKYLLLSTFPGLTVGRILATVPEAGALWPADAKPITFQ